MHYLGMCAIAKNETRYLREWVAHHYLIGFERFIIYDNESDEPVALTLKDYVEKGIVEVVPWPGKNAQLPAYADCMNRWHGKVRWVAFFDLDEFLILKKHKDARLLLPNFENFGALAVNWAVFGSSGHIHRPDGLILEQFTQVLPDDIARYHIKSIVRLETSRGMFDPHLALFYDGFHTVNEHGLPVVSAIAPYSVDTVQLNHYFFKSQQDYAAKQEKGRADVESLNFTRTWKLFFDQCRTAGTQQHIAEEHLRMVRLMVRTGIVHRLFDIDTQRLSAMQLYEIVEQLKHSDAGHAELILEACRARFAAVPEFLAQATMHYMQTGQYERAVKDCYSLIVREPSLGSFYMLFLLYITMKQLDEARSVGMYLRVASRRFGVDQEHETIQRLKELDARFQLGIY